MLNAAAAPKAAAFVRPSAADRGDAVYSGTDHTSAIDIVVLEEVEPGNIELKNVGLSERLTQ